MWNNKWSIITGIDGNKYHCCYFVVHATYAGNYINNDNFMRHLLLEFLADIGVVQQYVRDFVNKSETVYEIIIKIKD